MKSIKNVLITNVKIAQSLYAGLLILLIAPLLISSCKMDQDAFLSSAPKEGSAGNLLKSGTAGIEPTLFYGHEIFSRGNGVPLTVKKKIGTEDIVNFEPNFVIHIKNGDEFNNLVSSAVIKIDGKTIFKPSDFASKVTTLTRVITGLTVNSELEIKLQSAPGSYLEIWIDAFMPGNAYLSPEGGTISLLDGSFVLDLPQGAIDEAVVISITDISELPLVESGPADSKQYELLPHGLVFSKPVILTIPYQFNPVKSYNALAAFSESNGIWERLVIPQIDPVLKTAKIEINHFSMLNVQNQDPYLVIDIPGKYLKKGDLVYSLNNSSGYNWAPGQVGLYLGADQALNYENDGEKMIESDPSLGVHFSSLPDYVNDAGHLYLGARRYIGVTSYAERLTIAQSAINQLGKPGKIIGDHSALVNSVSCVELTESAYQDAGKEIVPTGAEIPVFYPQEQYLRTKPIDEITISSGEEITLKVYGVIWDATNAYVKSSDNLTVSGLPAGYTFEKSGDYWLFRWTPLQNQEGLTYDITFSLDGENGIQNQLISFKVVGAVDVEGNEYHSVTIGSQVWLFENLKTARYRNGDLIGTTILDTYGQSTAKYQWAYDNDENNVPTYGRLYTWSAVTDSRGLSPAGWHVPSDAEWVTLQTFLGGELIAGGKLKEAGTAHWLSPNAGATNITGFSALPSGYHEPYGPASEMLGEECYWWSSTSAPPTTSGALKGSSYWMYYGSSRLRRYNTLTEYGFSVRCIKN